MIGKMEGGEVEGGKTEREKMLEKQGKADEKVIEKGAIFLCNGRKKCEGKY